MNSNQIAVALFFIAVLCIVVIARIFYARRSAAELRRRAGVSDQILQQAWAARTRRSTMTRSYQTSSTGAVLETQSFQQFPHAGFAESPLAPSYGSTSSMDPPVYMTGGGGSFGGGGATSAWSDSSTCTSSDTGSASSSDSSSCSSSD